MLVRSSRVTARAGFTLTEILVVVAIIVVLASVAVPITLNVLNEAKVDVAKTQAKSLVNHVRTHMTKNAPPQDLKELLSPALGGVGTLTTDALVDPWGNQFQIRWQSEEEEVFDIISQGPGGSGAKAITISSLGTK